MALIEILSKDNVPQQILPIQENPASVVLTNAWQDLPTNHIIKSNDVSSIGIWLVITGGSGVKIRVQATHTLGSSEFFDLPIHSPTASLVGINPHIYEITATGNQNIVFSVPLADVINYLKIQVKGTGSIDKAYVTFRSR